MLNQIWRSSGGIHQRYVELGQQESQKDPYLLAGMLETILQLQLKKSAVDQA